MSDEITPDIEAQQDAPADAPETEVEDTDLDASESSTEETAEDQPRKSKGVQKRIDELTSNWRNTERDRDYWRELALKAHQAGEQPKPVPQAAPVAVADDPRPTLDSVDYDQEAFTEKLAEWKYRQLRREETAAEARNREAEARSSKVKTFADKVAEYDAANPGAMAAIHDPSLPLPQHVAEFAVESPVGVKIAHHLATNRDLAASIASMPIARAMAELGKLEARFESAPAAPVRQATKAPAPPPTLGGASPVSKDPNEMSVKDYIAWRAKTSNDPKWRNAR